MRLLNTATLKLHTFQENEAPVYAILSHTWRDEEVLFEDLKNIPQASKKAGFAKILFCCKQALKDDIEFVWVDTCCIDKASSTELSEAINSMYKWYNRAAVCYAYLGDISVPRNRIGPIDIDFFGRCRWFKRAWTLQELLAPRVVRFYSGDWNLIGRRDDLRRAISKATGIGEEYLAVALQHSSIQMTSVAKRMSWAARREATRPEDVAYSLFGIFDVHMPLLYGEGQQKAFRRLQEEIMKYSDDHTLFAWRIEGSNYVSEDGVLAQSPADFIRSRDLIPVRKTSAETPYTMTNIGLRISLPLNYDFTQSGLNKGISYEAPEVVLAALNCRKDGDFFHILTLPLRQIGSKQFVRYPGHRLEVVSTTSSSSYIVQEIFIRQNQLFGSLDWGQRNLGFIFRKLYLGTEIRGVYPPPFWNQNGKILQGPSMRGFTNKMSWHACVHLEIMAQSRGRHLVLFLGVGFRPLEPGTLHIVRAPWDEGDTLAEPWCALLDLPPGDKFLGELHSEFRISSKRLGGCEHRGVRVTFNEGFLDSDNAPFVDVLGEYMCVVDVILDPAT